jgi:hypothetical protein
MLREIMTTLCADSALHAAVPASTNSTGRGVCHKPLCRQLLSFSGKKCLFRSLSWNLGRNGRTLRAPNPSHHTQRLVQSRIKIWSQSHVMTDGRSWCRSPSGAHDQILGAVGKLRVCRCGPPSLARGRVCDVMFPVRYGLNSYIKL